MFAHVLRRPAAFIGWPGAAVALALVLAGPTQAFAQQPGYDRFREGVFLRYLDADAGVMRRVPQLGLSFGGRTYRAVLDTGSTGVVVAADMIPGFDTLPSAGEGRLTYTSSGRVMIGQWVTTPLTLVGQDGAQVVTSPLPVLAVTRVECLREARDCSENDDPRIIAMIGVGFAREHDRQSQSTPDKNPLLHVAPNGREQRRGYVLGIEGIHVGLTAANTQGDFQFVRLTRSPEAPDWSPVPACIAINGRMPAACGTMLVDTGVSAMFMTMPESQTGGPARQLPPGTTVSISAGPPESRFPLYDFAVGDASPLAPDAIHLNVSDERVFVNTSFHLLNGFDVLYDADGGYAGFRRRR
jgi:hypothetical protein